MCHRDCDYYDPHPSFPNRDFISHFVLFAHLKNLIALPKAAVPRRYTIRQYVADIDLRRRLTVHLIIAAALHAVPAGRVATASVASAARCTVYVADGESQLLLAVRLLQRNFLQGEATNHRATNLAILHPPAHSATGGRVVVDHRLRGNGAAASPAQRAMPKKWST